MKQVFHLCKDKCFYGMCTTYPPCGGCCSCIGGCLYESMDNDARNQEEES